MRKLIALLLTTSIIAAGLVYAAATTSHATYFSPFYSVLRKVAVVRQYLRYTYPVLNYEVAHAPYQRKVSMIYPQLSGVRIKNGYIYDLVNGSLLYSPKAPWVNCSYLVREGFVIIPATQGNVTGYVDINVTNSTLLAYLRKNPSSALITLDGLSSPLTYYVYDVGTSYIIYRVFLRNVSNGPHTIWVYAGGNYSDVGYPGVPIVLSYSGTPLSNYTVLLLGNNYNTFIEDGHILEAYTDGFLTYVNVRSVRDGAVIYARNDVNGSLTSEFHKWVKYIVTYSGAWDVSAADRSIKFVLTSSSTDWQYFTFNFNITPPGRILANVTSTTTQDGLHAIEVNVYGTDVAQYFIGRDDASKLFPTGFGYKYIYDIGGNGWDGGGGLGLLNAGTNPYRMYFNSTAVTFVGTTSYTKLLSIGSLATVKLAVASKNPFNYVKWSDVKIVNGSTVIDLSGLVYSVPQLSPIIPLLYMSATGVEDRPVSCLVTPSSITSNTGGGAVAVGGGGLPVGAAVTVTATSTPYTYTTSNSQVLPFGLQTITKSVHDWIVALGSNSSTKLLLGVLAVLGLLLLLAGGSGKKGRRR